MVKFENECVGCPPEVGCAGSACPYRNVPHLICDNCGEEVDTLYHYDGGEWCVDCILEDCGEVDVDKEGPYWGDTDDDRDYEE